MEPITVAQLAMLLVVGFLLFRTQSGPRQHRSWRGIRRHPGISPAAFEDRAEGRKADWLRVRSSNAPAWVYGAAILLAGALIWWFNQ